MFIFLKEGKEDIFYQFEELAIPLLNDYNGSLIYRIRPSVENYIHAESVLPYEIHFLSFGSENDFINFTQDERRKTFLHLKEDSISSVLLVKGKAH